MQEQETVQKLKAERVQKSVSKKKRLPLPDDPLGSKALHKAQDRLKAERVQERLKRLPGWKLQPGGQAIDRVLEFPDGVVAAAFASFAATLATRSGQGLRCQRSPKIPPSRSAKNPPPPRFAVVVLLDLVAGPVGAVGGAAVWRRPRSCGKRRFWRFP